MKKTWYDFDYRNEELEFDTPLVQIKLVNTLKKAEKVEEIGKIMPTIPLDHFRSFTLNHLKEYKTEFLDTLLKPSSKPTSNLSNSTSQANNASSPSSSSSPSPLTPAELNSTKPACVTPIAPHFCLTCKEPESSTPTK